MRLQVHLDDETIRQRAARGPSSLLVFEVWWEHDGACYPCEHFTDFGEEVLWWWLEEARMLVAGPSTGLRLRFMDGPYELVGRYDRTAELLHFSARDLATDWTVPVVEVVEQLIIATDTIRSELARLDIPARVYVPALLQAALPRLRGQS